MDDLWNGLGTCDALLCVSHTLQGALENGQEAQIVQIDFSAAFDGSTIWAFSIRSALWVLRFCPVYIDRVSIKPITVMVDGCQSKLVNVLSGVLQGSVLGPLLFLLYTSELFSILENTLIFMPMTPL